MIVVIGATGNVGRPLMALLGSSARAVSRHGEFPADLGRPSSLAPALAGAEALFLLLAGEQLVSGPAPAELLDVVGSAGVRRLVLLSSQGARSHPDSISHGRLAGFERALRGTDLEWTILRPGAFASNTLAWMPSIRASRTVYAPFGDVGLPVVDPADIAAVAAAALLDGKHAGQIYELTGPELITPREQARTIGADIRFVEQTRDQAREAMLAFMPAPVADTTLDILGHPGEEGQRVRPDIQAVLGRPAAPFRAWADRQPWVDA